jgi:hypothetical protein
MTRQTGKGLPGVTTTATDRGRPAWLESIGDPSAFWRKGSRQAAANALAGWLLLAGRSDEEAGDIVSALAQAAGDDEVPKRVNAVQATAAKIRDGQRVTGFPSLAALIGEDAAKRLAEAIGLGVRFNLKALAEFKCLPVEFLLSLGLSDLPGGGVAVPYRDAGGRVAQVKKRLGLEGRTGRWPAGKPVLAYGEERLAEAKTDGYLVLVEGESDVWTLQYHSIPCLGLPGARTVKSTLALGHVAAVRKVYVMEEPDQAGMDFVANVKAQLVTLGWKGKLLIVRLHGAKDPSELHCRLDPDDFKGRFNEALDAAEPVELRSAGKPSVRLLDPYQPFPVHLLPDPLAEYVRQGASALWCDPVYVALPALAAVASVIGSTRTIRLKRGWEEPCIVWSAVIADSGTLKSPAWLMAVGFLFRLQKRLLAEFKQKHAAYQEELAEYKERKRKAKEEGSEAGNPPEEPVLVRVVCSDTTIEKLAEILEDNPHGVLLTRDELNGWLTSFSRYKGNQGGTDLPLWLESYRAGPWLVDRKTGDRRTSFVPRTVVSVTGGIQPNVLAGALTDDFLDAGLPARLLLAMPPKLAKRWSELEVEPDAEQSYHALLDGLLALDFDRDSQGEQAPHALRLSAEAKAIWVAFYDDWAQEQAAAEGAMAAAYAKLEAYAARLSLLHHVVTCVGRNADDRQEVGARSVEAGIGLARWFASEARRIYAMLGESPEERQDRRLVEFIRSQGGRITTRQLQRSNPARYRAAEQAEAALHGLVESGLAEWHRHQPEGGGRPSQVCVLLANLTVDNNRQNPWAFDEGDQRSHGDGPDRTWDTPRVSSGFAATNEISSVSVNRRVQETAEATGGPACDEATNARNAFCQADPVSPGTLGKGDASGGPIAVDLEDEIVEGDIP